MTTAGGATLELARTVADAVLYEGYLLYPYRATSAKNQARWQFGVLGPPGAAAAGVGEESTMATECLVRDEGGPDGGGTVTVRLRFLQLQVREAQRVDQRADQRPDHFVTVDGLSVGATEWLTWDEAVEHELELPACRIADINGELMLSAQVPGGEDVEPLTAPDGSVAGRLVRRRWPLQAEVRLSRVGDSGLDRLQVTVENVTTGSDADGRGAGGGAGAAGAGAKDAAIRGSFIGAHLLVTAESASFVSLLDPPDDAAEAAARCRQRRCWPVLAGPPGSSDVVLGSPIILYDHPEVAQQSMGELFDSTEIDEILTLRVMTMTDDEKAQARATDPRAAQIIDRCDSMTPEQLQQLHGVLRDPSRDLLGEPLIEPVNEPVPDDVPWWDPAVDGSVRPGADVVLVDGVAVSGGSRVRIRPRRRADAQDLFFAGQEARVAAVHSDVDGNTHVAVVLADDPAADLHDWYGRYLYFAPDELEPLNAAAGPDSREESRL